MSEELMGIEAAHQIAPLGTILHTDAEGYLISQSSVEKIISPWKEAVEEIKAVYISHLGDSLHSVYIRGTVSRGTAIEGVSDIDSIAFVNIDPEDMEGLEERIENGKNRVGRAMLKVSSACVYGPDLAPNLPKVKPGPDMYSMVWQFNNDIHSRVEKIKSGERGLDGNQCRWMMKRILRAGMELVMEREQVFTRDLYPCYELFSKQYPAWEPAMYHALELAINPSSNQEEVLGVAESLGYWLGGEIREKLGIPLA